MANIIGNELTTTTVSEIRQLEKSCNHSLKDNSSPWKSDSYTTELHMGNIVSVVHAHTLQQNIGFTKIVDMSKAWQYFQLMMP